MSPAHSVGIFALALVGVALGAACTQILGIEQRPLRPDAGSAYAEAVLEDSPVLYLRFGEDGGVVAHDETHQFDGTYPMHGITFGVEGAIADDSNTAIALDGTAKIRMPPGADFEPDAAFSVEVWVLLSGTVTEYEYIVDHETFDPNRAGWDLLVGAGTEFERWAGGQNGGTAISAPIKTGAWHYLVATFDGSSDHLQYVYLDGNVVATAPNVAHVPKIPGDWSIGAQNCDLCGGNGFSGKLDELAIYKGVLSLDRIRAHLRAAKGIAEAGP